MRHKVFAIAALCAFVVLCALPAIVFAQANTTQANTQANITPSRITQAIDEANLTQLRGNTHPLAQARFDQGAAPDSLPMQRMLLVLKRSPTQESALDALLDQQQDSTSANFHQWLTPQQFGQQFGPSDQDIQTITDWLQSHGFTVAGVSNGRTVIEFSGTAGQVRQAFHTEIHRYTMNGQDHWANAADPQIPSALTPVVAGINTLYNFPRQAMHEVVGTGSRSASNTSEYQSASPAAPLFNINGNCGVAGSGCHWLSPYDFAAIYNVLPLWNASTDGTGQTIAIVGESDISLQDVQSFRSYFALPAPKVNVMVEGSDPGIVPGDETESDLDVEWSGAVARGATIDFVISQSTDSTSGVDLSAQYIVDNNVAPILSESYGNCELFLGASSNQFFNQLWQQASAEGITVLVSTGDSGSAVCDRNTPGAALHGLSVNGISSTPYNVAVGGTDFFDLTDFSTFWGSDKAPVPGAKATLSALSYIPETTWNNSCTNAVFGNLLGYSPNPETNCNNSQLSVDGAVHAVGGSGGMSNCIASTGSAPSTCTDGYAKPLWQVGVTPADGSRDLPDVSLYAAVGSPSGSAYALCAADQLESGHTSCDASQPTTYFVGIGGTSASAPTFAGIMALVDQATGSRQGNANYVLYKLATAANASCNSTGTLNLNCAFYDTTNGTIAMPCAINSPDEPGPDSSTCPIQTLGDTVGVLSAYSTTAGYDEATGLGSVNAANLVSNWNTLNSSLKSSATTLTLNNDNPVSITHGQSVPIQVSVTGSGATPTGTVALMANVGSGPAQSVASAALSNGSATFSTMDLPGDPAGASSYTVFAEYSGDATYASSQSGPSPVTVGPEASATNITIKLYSPATGQIQNPTPSSYSYGSLYALVRANVTSSAADACSTNGVPVTGNYGCPTGSVTVTDAVSGGTPSLLDAGMYTLNTQGYAEDQAANFPAGTNMIQASYLGDNSYLSSTGSTAITVVQALGSILATPPPTANYEDPYTVNATVQGISAAIGVPPTGQVSLFAGATQIGGPVSLSNGIPGSSKGWASASATIVTSQLPLGTTPLTVKYTGDNNYTANSAQGYSVVTQYLTSVAVTSSSPTIQHGASATFTATVTAEHPGGPTMTGTVTFLDGGSPLGPPITLVSGQAQFVASSLSAGNHAITVQYSGDTNYTSAAGTLAGGETVNLLQTTTTVTTSNASIAVGQSVTLTATVSPTVAGGPAITGFVVFYSCPTSDINNCLLPVGNAPLSNGQAQAITTAIPNGTIEVLAIYSGDSNYSYSSATTPEIAGPYFSISANPASLTISAPGQSASTTLTFTSQNGLAGTGTLVSPGCGTLSANGITCSLSPFTLPASGTTIATLTFHTTAGSSIPQVVRYERPAPGANSVRVLSFALFLLSVPLLFTARRGRRMVLSTLVFAVIVSGISCGGGGGNGGSGGGGGGPGTPVGAVSPLAVTITVNGVTQTVPNLTLTVN